MTALDFLRAEVAQLRAICDAATAGPWWQDGQGPWKVHHGKSCDRVTTCNTEIETNQDKAPSFIAIENAAFIVAARSAMPALLSVLEEEIARHAPVPEGLSRRTWCACGLKWTERGCDNPRIVSAAKALGWSDAK